MDIDALSASSVLDTVGYFTYILSINPPRDLAVNTTIPILQMKKRAQRLACLGQGHTPINSRVRFKTKVCLASKLISV